MNISTLTNKGTIEIELKEKFYIGFLLYILKLILDQVWTTSVWTGLIPTGTDRFETESNRTDTIGPVRSICISRTDRSGPNASSDRRPTDLDRYANHTYKRWDVI